MVFYLQQNVVLLDQISKQILSIAPQATITPTPPPPFPFKPSESDIRVNVFWFMALIFSLAAALLAILMQQWVRDYMQVFQRYGDPLKCARTRQYLYKALTDGYMPDVAEAVPGFLHVSLFLFFAGLCDFVLNINTRVGIGTTVPIAITGLLYIIATFVPTIRPQSPYRTWFSTILFVIIPAMFSFIISIRCHQQKSDGSQPVRLTTTERRMQLAMKDTPQRKVRDEKAIQWLIRNMTEDAEVESLVMAIPGSFNCKWGLNVWKDVSKPPTNGDHVIDELNTRVTHLMETCKNRDLFAGDELWRKRTRGCVETLSLVGFTGTHLRQFGDIVEPLGVIGVELKVRESSSEGKDLMFVMRWTCLSLVAIQPTLAFDPELRSHASLAMSSLTEGKYHTGEGQTPTDIIGIFKKALECLEELSNALILVEDIGEGDAKQILRAHESAISTLADIGDQYDGSADTWIQDVQRDLVKTTHRIICQLPGIKFADPDAKSAYISQLEEPHLSQFEEACLGQLKELYLGQLKESYLSQLKESYRDYHKSQFIPPSHRFERIKQFADTFQNLQVQWNDVAFKEGIKDLKEVLSLLKDDPLRREIWRLQDLCDGRGLGFTVELFFLALKQLLSMSSSKESHSALLMGTFQAITSDWSEDKSPLGTQQLLLDLVVSDNDIVFGSTDTYPDITDEFLKLLPAVLKGPHIVDIVELLKKKLKDRLIPTRRTFYQKALTEINKAIAPEQVP